MALLFMDGFDYWNWYDGLVKWDGQQYAYANEAGRNGGKCISMHQNGSYINKSTLPNTTTIILGIACNLPNNPASINFLHLGDATVTHLAFRIDANRKIACYHGNGTLLGTGVSVTNNYTWFYLEIKATIADAGGYVEVHIDEIPQFTFSGDTRNGGTAYVNKISICGTEYNYSTNFDDVYVLDTTGPAPLNDFLGDVRIDTIRPSGAGSSTQWTPSAGSNFQCVDELLVNRDTDYISSAVNGDKDLFAMVDLPAAMAGTVFAVAAHSIVKKIGSDVTGVRNVIKTPVGEYTGLTVDPSVFGYVDVGTIWTLNPETGLVWLKSEIDALEAGIENVS